MRVLNLEGKCSFANYFLICSGTSSRHTRAICDAIQEELGKTGVRATHIEGYPQAEWILMDYLDFVVHIFTPQAREFYRLDRLWGEAPQQVLEATAS